MAVVNVAQSFNMLAAQDWAWSVTSATATFVQISDGTHTQNYSGSFAYDALDRVSGTVTATSYYLGGALVYSVTGLNLSAAQMQVFAETAGDTQATYAYVLAGADTINGSGGADLLLAYGGNDSVNGGGGNDSLYGGSGADTLAGGAGNDVFYVDNTLDRVVEGAIVGIDRVQSTVNWTLGANLENLTLAGSGLINGSGNAVANVIVGNNAANTLTGLGGNDSLAGGAGNDRLIGGTGADTMLGGLGNDILYGGAGQDVLTGGAGLDGFRFNSTLSATGNVDRITDFTSADDSFGLDDAYFAGIGAVGALASGAFKAGTTATDSSDRIVYDAATGHLYFDADGNGAGTAILFATVAAHTVVNAGDFYVI